MAAAPMMKVRLLVLISMPPCNAGSSSDEAVTMLDAADGRDSLHL
jgi:hypothetical protein